MAQKDFIKIIMVMIEICFRIYPRDIILME